jgi:hypothetical protein
MTVMALLVLCGACNSGDCPAPVVTAVAPHVVSSEKGTEITIIGRHFCLKAYADFTRSDGLEVHEDFAAQLVDAAENPTTYELVNVQRQNLESITAHVPLGVELGSHTLQLINPYGRLARLEDAVTVVERLVGAECAIDDDCLSDPCVTVKTCTDGLCIYDKDADGDGYVDAACGGSDCDDDPTTCGADCWPGNDAPDFCDGRNQDCDERVDEDYVVDSSCGKGYCRSTNTPSSCNIGIESVCVPGIPLSSIDTTCDSVDDDCNGEPDEDYVPDSTCGVGYCRATNTPSSCNDGVEALCQPGTPLSADDATCDGVDDNCNGKIDEDAGGSTIFYYDADGDGFTRSDDTQTACVDPDGPGINWVDTPTPDDCDDSNSSVYHGSECDDLDACTDGDLCHDGLCEGYRTSACGGCSSDCSAACGAGQCCVETCVAGSCPDCDADCSCDLTCTGTDNCAIQCNPGSVCRFSATATEEHNDLTCADATCTLECTETGKHCRMSCTGSAVCVMECVDVTRNCLTTCSDESTCIMTCDGNLRDCELVADDTANGLIECINVAGNCLPTCTSPATCTATLIACNRPCP